MSKSQNITDMNFLITQIKKDLEKEFQRKMKKRESSARNINRIIDRNASFGDRIADKVAQVGGSWMFIISFCFFLMLWMIANSIFLAQNAFDPYPYILLNLCLSTVAALQAPIIMMSQNRQARKDRLEAEEDFQTNTRSEVQIQEVIAKLDLFMEMYIKFSLETKDVQLENISARLEELHEKLQKHIGQ